MEFANQLPNPKSVQSDEILKARVAKKSDAPAITRLLHSARLTHYHVDWRLPADWLGDEGFVVIPEAGLSSPETPKPSLLLPRDEMLACLVVTADPMPAAWVRLTAVSGLLDPHMALAEMFALVKDHLRKTAVTEVGWLVLERWPVSILPDLGFEQMTVIETYVKDNLKVPDVQPVPDLVIRPAEVWDFTELAALETAVFEPLWRFSKEALMLAHRDAVSFDVAVLDDDLVGYQISSGGRAGGHLVRLTISPEVQGTGVGSAIFSHAFTDYQRRGYRQVTLNTQVDNTASHRLYKKFGFAPSGEKMPLWVMRVQAS